MTRKRVNHILANAFSVILLFVEPLILFLIALNSSEVYSQPLIENAIMDFSNEEYIPNGITLFGDVEFYYNQWIVTEEKDELNGSITLPSSWAGKRIVQEDKTIILDGTGYASYRFTIKGVPSEATLSISKKDYGDSFRVFFNKSLIYSSGKIAKSSKENESEPREVESTVYRVKEDEDIEVIIEVGANDSGGLLEAIVFTPTGNYNRNSSIYQALIFFAIGIMIGIILTSSIFSLSTSSNYFVMLLLLTCSFFVIFLSSVDGLFLLNMYSVFFNYQVAYCLNYAFSFLAIYIFILLFKENGIISLKRKTISRINTAFITTLFFSIVLSSSPISGLFQPLLTLFSSGLSFYLLKNVAKDKSVISYLYLFLFNMFTGLNISKSVITIFSLPIKPEYYSTVVLIAISTFIILCFIYHFFILEKEKRKSEQLSSAISDIKETALKEQIKPHYLFNTLANVKSAYKESVQKGDETLHSFSTNYRLSLVAIQKEMIPFKEEIENITRYLDFENLNLERKFELILNIEYADFEVPPYSIQPLVENSVNYSKVNLKEDGYILLSSELNGDEIVIVVEDNGVGFNPLLNKSDSIGQKNLKERIALHLNGDVNVESVPNQGTKTTIKFKKRTHD